MSQTAQINIKVDSKGAENSVNNLNNSINESSKSTQSLRSQLRQVTQELQGLEPGSKRFDELSRKAGQLKDTIQDTNAVINATAGSGVENLGKGLQETAQIGISGFQGLVSAQALFGSESKELEQTLVKLQALAGLSDAISSLGGLKDSITNIKAAFGTFGKSAVTALQGVKGAVMATGIGLLVVAVGTLVAYWDDIKGLVSGVSSEQEKLNKQAEANVKLQNSKKDALNDQDNILRLQGLTEKQILQIKLKQTGQQIQALKISIEQQEKTLKSQIEAEKRNKTILKGIIQFVNAPLDLILRTIDGIGSFLGKDWNLADDLNEWAASLLFDPNQVKEEGMATINEARSTLKKLENEQAGYLLEIKRLDKEEVDNRNKLKKEQADKNKEAYKQSVEEETKRREEELERQRQLQDSQVSLLKEGLDKELKENELKYNRMIEDTKKGQSTISKETQLIIDNYNTKKLQEDERIRSEWLKKEIEINEQKLLAEKKLRDDMRALDDAEYKKDTEIRDKKIDLMKDGVDKELKIREAQYQDDLYSLQNNLDDKLISQEQYQQLVIDTTKKYQDDVNKIEKDGADKSIKIQQDKYDNISEQLDLWGSATMELANSISTMFDTISQNRINKLNDTFKLESQLLKQQYDQRLISEEEYQSQLSQMMEVKDQEERKLKLKQFKRDKALNIAEAVMSGAQAVLQALASAPPPINFILAGIAGAASAVQIGTISQQQFTAAKGGIVPQNGLPGDVDSVPSILAPGEAVINSRSTSMFPQVLSLINQAGGGKPLLPNNIGGNVTTGGDLFNSTSQQSPTIKAYVVESEITSSQKRINRIERSVEF